VTCADRGAATYRVLRVSEELRRATRKALRHQGVPRRGHLLRGHHDAAQGRSRDFCPVAAPRVPACGQPAMAPPPEFWRRRHSPAGAKEWGL